jgi:small-conductance mechanosensitive channel
MRFSFSFEVGGSQSSGRTSESTSKANWLSIYRCATLSLVLGLAIAARAILFFGYYGGAVDFARNISVASIVWVVLACVTRCSTALRISNLPKE